MRVPCWQMTRAGQAVELGWQELAEPKEGEALVRVAGCGICHTDLGYLFDGVRTRHPLPLTLGHEIAGVVESAPGPYRGLEGRSVVVPAVIPCGVCALCLKGRGSICRAQIFPGCDIQGGFASHVLVPARGLCPVDSEALAAAGLELAELAVVADAVTTPYQAIVRSGLGRGDLAIFVGAGGVGGFGVQIAHALGAEVVAVDVDPKRLEKVRGASLRLDVRSMEARAVRQAIAAFAQERKLPELEWKIFETSGNAKGQELAFSLLTYGAYLAVVGYTLEKVSLRLSNLMAFDATAQGNWGCLPELYPAALKLVLEGKVLLGPFVERRPMSQVNEILDALRRHELASRPVLVPDFKERPT
jgi:6-hydroxycyclohex-1-ene-1-carbonyl-CoA dehydrogenase